MVVRFNPSFEASSREDGRRAPLCKSPLSINRRKYSPSCRYKGTSEDGSRLGRNSIDELLVYQKWTGKWTGRRPSNGKFFCLSGDLTTRIEYEQPHAIFSNRHARNRNSGRRPGGQEKCR